MIASVRGRVLAVRLDSVVVDVGGVGLLLHATPNTLAALRPGEPAELATSLVVREDALTLFGFADADERDVFEIVQTVSGIGPRLALAMLAVHSPQGLRAAVSGQDLTALTKVPGIGRKGAQRIVLELTDRLGAAAAGSGSGSGSVATGTAVLDLGPAPAWREQVTDALVGLGWPARQAGAAVDAVAGQGAGGDSADQPPDVAAVLRQALRHLGRSG